MRLRSYRKLTSVLIILIGLLPVSAALAEYDWLQFNGDSQHSGNTSQEFLLTLNNVSGLTRQYQITLPTTADGAPAYLSNVPINNVLINLLFVTTKNGYIVALNAHTGATVWSHQNGPGSCKINNGSNTCYTTSSPAVDPNRQYVYSYGLDGKAHKYQVADGTEITANGWPETTTLKAFDEKGSSALSLITANDGSHYLYVANGGYPGDNGDYQGHVTVINLATGIQNVFNTMCSNQPTHFTTGTSPDCNGVQTAVWGRSAAVYDAATNKVYLSTGNGTFDPSKFYWGDTVLALNPQGTGTSLGNQIDSYTPTEYQSLQNNDADIGSTSPVIVPVPAGYPIAHLGLQSGKDAMLRLINLDNLSGMGGSGHTGGELLKVDVPQQGEVLTAPIAWVNADGSTWIFVVNGNGASALKLGATGSTPTLSTEWQTTNGGASPIIANGILFYASGGTLRALNPVTGAQVWSASIGGIHWESPIVADGWVYVSDESGHLSAYALPQPTPVAHTIGVYRTGTFYLHNSNVAGFAEFAISITPSVAQPIPVVGDWMGGGIDTIGVYDQSSGLFSLRNSNTTGTPDRQFAFGNPGDTSLAGVWLHGLGHAGIGVARANGLTYLRYALSSGYSDQSAIFGSPGDSALVGDWNGDGVTTYGVYRAASTQFFLTDHMGSGILNSEYFFNYGAAGDRPIAGDWAGIGRAGVGVYRPANTVLLRNQLFTGFPDNSFLYGNPGDVPVVGHWGTPPPLPPVALPSIAPKVITPATPNGASAPGGNQIGG